MVAAKRVWAGERDRCYVRDEDFYTFCTQDSWLMVEVRRESFAMPSIPVMNQDRSSPCIVPGFDVLDGTRRAPYFPR